MKLISFFSRLQWKLALSYAIVTAGTVIVLAGLLVGTALYFESRNIDNLNNSFYWTKTGFQNNIPFLLDDPKDLQAWLERVQSEGFSESDFNQFYTVRETMSHANTITTGEPIFILDPELNITAASPLDDSKIIGKPYETYAPQGYEITALIDGILAGDKNYYAQSILYPDSSYLAAFPLRASDDDPVVAIVVYHAKPFPSVLPVNVDLYGTFFTFTAIGMFIISLPLGAVFGWLASRGLRKRLVNLSVATQAWSKGDFSSTLCDKSGDEIGELTRNLNSMAEQLQTLLTTRQELTRIEERNRLARDLHDTVKQQTYAARMQLTAAKNLFATNPPAATEHLESALQLNRETQQELKLIIDELRPAALEGRGLAQALTDYAARWQEHTGIKVETNITGERPLSLDVEQVLYRIVQESLANVARHAEADTVTLTLNLTPEQVILSIADNGRGFEPAAVTPTSYGLTGMKQRLAEIGGTLTVESTLAVGTKVIAEVKL